MSQEARKQEEIDFHNRLRSAQLREDPEAYAFYSSNEKFYSVDRANRRFCEEWLRTRCPGRRVLDLCCGEGDYSLVAARLGGKTVGIDISDVGIGLCRERAAREGLAVSFQVGDAERTPFRDGAFDVVICAGVLHHLDLDAAYREIARVLSPSGEVICMEPLKHNPLFQLYRRRTPHLRTSYEMQHILGVSDVALARRWFGKVELRFFHLATLLGVPLRKRRGFPALLGALEAVDRVVLRVPGLRRLAWMAVFTLAGPLKR